MGVHGEGVVELACLDNDAHNALTDLSSRRDEEGVDIAVAFVKVFLTRLESLSLKGPEI